MLLIEDDAAMRSAIAEQLQSEDYQVMQAADGAEALQECLRHAQGIDVVLTDVNATRMSGEDLMGYFAIKYPRMVVIHMSGFSRPVLEQMHAIPPDALFLSKPFTAEQLRQTMQVALQAGERGEKNRHRE